MIAIVKRKCDSELYLSDRECPGPCTIMCEMEAGHAGSHRREYGTTVWGLVRITWEHDTAEVLPFTDDASESLDLAETTPSVYNWRDVKRVAA